MNDKYLNISPQETKVTEWMINLVSDIKNAKEEKFSSNFDLKSLIEKTTSQAPVKKVRSVSETSEPELNNKKRSSRLSETSEVGSSDEAEIEAGVATLLEMFPSCSKVEAVHCLTIKGGDLEMAAQMILTRMEMGEDIKLSQAEVKLPGSLTSHISPHTSHLSPLTSHLSPHTSYLIPSGSKGSRRRSPGENREVLRGGGQ